MGDHTQESGRDLTEIGEEILACLDQFILNCSIADDQYEDMIGLLDSFHAQVEADETLATEEKQLFTNMYAESMAILKELHHAAHATDQAGGVSGGIRGVDAAANAAGGTNTETAVVPGPNATATAPSIIAEGGDRSAAAAPQLSFTTRELLEDLEAVLLTKIQLAIEDNVLDADEFEDIARTLKRIRTTVDGVEGFDADERAILDRMCSRGRQLLMSVQNKAPIPAGEVEPLAAAASMAALRNLEQKLGNQLDMIHAGSGLTDSDREGIQSIIDEMVSVIYEDNIVTPEEQEIMTRVFERTLATYRRALESIANK